MIFIRTDRNSQKLKLPLALSICAFLSACASVSVSSKPTGADVILAVPGQETGKSLGKTPLTQNLSEISKFSNKSTITVTLKKPGYRNQTFVIPNLGGGRLEIEANLQPIGSDDSADINLAVRYMLEAERQIIDRNLKEALKTLEKAKAANPNIAAVFMFEGMVHMLQNENEKAREALYKALALDPQDTEIRSLLSETTGGSSDSAPAKGKGKK